MKIKLGSISFETFGPNTYLKQGAFGSTPLPQGVRTLMKAYLDLSGNGATPQATGQATSCDRINVNQATEKVLALLPGIGDVTASVIVEKRQAEPFKSFVDLQERTEVNLKGSVEELISF